MQVLTDIDNSRNPMLMTKERLERAATENQFLNGKIAAISVRTLPRQRNSTHHRYPVVPRIAQRSHPTKLSRS